MSVNWIMDEAMKVLELIQRKFESDGVCDNENLIQRLRELKSIFSVEEEVQELMKNTSES